MSKVPEMLSFLSYLFVWAKYFRFFGKIVMSKCKSIVSVVLCGQVL